MERARVRLPFQHLQRTIEPGIDPETAVVGTIGGRGEAIETVNLPPWPLSGRVARARFESVTGSFDPPGEESHSRLLGAAAPHGQVARAVFLLIFAAILFLSGIFIGASFTANPPRRPPPTAGGVFVPIPALLEIPTPSSSTIAAPLPEPAPQPQLTGMAAAEPPAPPSSASAADGVQAGSDPGSASAPVSEEPVVSALPVPPEPLTDLPIAPEATVSAPTPAPAPVAAAAPSRPSLSEPQRQALLARGDTYFSAGDVTSARLFYQRGADAGDGTAALRLGETFDAAFLERAGLGRVPSDSEKAIGLYRQAVELGNAEAGILLRSLGQK